MTNKTSAEMGIRVSKILPLFFIGGRIVEVRRGRGWGAGIGRVEERGERCCKKNTQREGQINKNEKFLVSGGYHVTSTWYIRSIHFGFRRVKFEESKRREW